MKKVFVLVGPPSVGKSTWVKNNLVSPYIISRDDIVEIVAEEYGWTYDDLFVKPSKDDIIGSIDEKYGEVIKSPSSITWSPLSYSKVIEANAKVSQLFSNKVTKGRGEDVIVVDMTNMSIDSRRGALKIIKGIENEYNKVAVVFNFKGREDLIKSVARKRSDELKKVGKSKTISGSVFDMMFSRFQDIDESEGFDEVIYVDNVNILRNVVFIYKKTPY